MLSDCRVSHILYICLRGRMVNLVGCHSEVQEFDSWVVRIIAYISFSRKFGCNLQSSSACPSHPRHRVSLVQGSERVRYLFIIVIHVTDTLITPSLFSVNGLVFSADAIGLMYVP